ncbi:DUF2867 domain-containing protein [Sphingobacterium sp. E70]|nr:DUF2867 domain-containing protein [Sphingobacterium sp. E70]ULT29146.1 DUF2867 domain-containing protein [Sphingobacterium sp. E70]
MENPWIHGSIGRRCGYAKGRKNKSDLAAGDALDFWRVLIADRKTKRLLLYAEMKLPGEAWLEFKIEDNMLLQTATFRPLGIADGSIGVPYGLFMASYLGA